MKPKLMVDCCYCMSTQDVKDPPPCLMVCKKCKRPFRVLIAASSKTKQLELNEDAQKSYLDVPGDVA